MYFLYETSELNESKKQAKLSYLIASSLYSSRGHGGAPMKKRNRDGKTELYVDCYQYRQASRPPVENS
jgi:hypothetical protein